MSLPISIGSGATVATDLVGGAHYGYNKISDGTPGSTNALVVDSAGSAQVAIKGNVTLANSKGYIGLVTVANTVPVTGSFWQTTQPVSTVGNITIDSQIAWPDPKTFIGLTTSVIGFAPTIFAVVNTGAGSGNVTLDSGSKTGLVGTVTIQDGGNSITVDGNVGITGNVSISSNIAWPDPKGYIGLVTITGSLAAASGNVTLDPGSKTGLVGNVTLTDSKGFIGLTTAVNGQAWPDPKGFIGLVTITGSLAAAAGNITLDPGSQTQLIGNVTLTDSKKYIGLVSVSGFTNPLPVSFSGNVTIDSGTITTITNPVAIKGNVTISGVVSTSFAGNITIDSGVITTITNPVALKGNVTIDSVANPIALKGNITLSDPKTYIGLVTTTPGAAWPDPKGFIGLVTITGSLAAAAGNITLDGGSKTQIVGNVTLSDPKTGIGLVTLMGGTAWTDPKTFIGLTTAVNGQAWPDPKGFIGLVTITGSLAAAAGNITLDAGSKTQIVGNVTLSDPKTYIGLTTVTLAPYPLLGGGAAAGMFVSTASGSGIFSVLLDSGSGHSANIEASGALDVQAVDSKGFIGLVTLGGGFSNLRGNVTLDAGSFTGLKGNVTLDVGSLVGLRGNVTIQDGGGAITTDIIGNVTISDSKGYIGLVTATVASGTVTIQDGGNTISTDVIGNVTISDSKGFIGLVTAVVAFTPGTGKTLVNLPISFLSAGSQATIVVPGTNTAVYITNMLLNSDATVRVNIKSGVTYLTGNASVGITLNPGGGFVMSGSVDSPVWIGCPSGALIIEKLDLTGTSAKVGGNVVYFQQ